jgi:hypothetical protein
MNRGSRYLGKIIGPYSRPYVPTSAARVRNAFVGAGASGGQSLNVQSGRYNKPAGCSTSVACRGPPWKQTYNCNNGIVTSMYMLLRYIILGKHFKFSQHQYVKLNLKVMGKREHFTFRINARRGVDFSFSIQCAVWSKSLYCDKLDNHKKTKRQKKGGEGENEMIDRRREWFRRAESETTDVEGNNTKEWTYVVLEAKAQRIVRPRSNYVLHLK